MALPSPHRCPQRDFKKTRLYDAALKKRELKRGHLAVAPRLMQTLRSWPEGVCIRLNTAEVFPQCLGSWISHTVRKSDACAIWAMHRPTAPERKENGFPPSRPPPASRFGAGHRPRTAARKYCFGKRWTSARVPLHVGSSWHLSSAGETGRCAGRSRDLDRGRW